jgi:hypothetical protein
MSSDADGENNLPEDEILYNTTLFKIKEGDLKGARDALLEAI